MEKEFSFHVPCRPYSPIDAHNRRSAALGSVGYAQATAHASYNGHRVTVSWNSYRRYWIAEYFWAGRVVLARGSFLDCLRAALAEHEKGALGSEVRITIPEEDKEALDAAKNDSRLVEGKESERSWWTWRHDVGCESARDAGNPGCRPLIFDWQICQAATDREDYESRLKTKYGQVYS